jgi:head-tail adaptor
MRAGLLRHRLSYQEPAKAPNGLGQRASVGYTVVSALLYGEVRSPNGREAIIAQAFKSTVSHVITIRKPPYPIRPKGRLVDLDGTNGTAVYEVVAAADETGRRRELKVYAIETVV